MSMLMMRCPQSGLAVSTGIETDPPSLQRMPDVLAYTACPHCGFEHAWWTDEAWLTPTMQLQSSSNADLSPALEL